MNACGTWWQREGLVWTNDGKARSRATEICCSVLFPGSLLSDCSGSCNPEAGLLGRPSKTHWYFSFLCFTVKCISYLKKQPQRTDKPNRSGRPGIRILSSRSSEARIHCLHWNLAVFHEESQSKWILPLPQWRPHPQPRGRALAISQEKQFQKKTVNNLFQWSISWRGPTTLSPTFSLLNQSLTHNSCS